MPNDQGNSARGIERGAFDKAYRRVADAVTLYAFHAVRLAQMTQRRAQRHKIVSWLER